MQITLALGGGGAKGNAHIGVIRRLEKEGIKIEGVAGTSFGGLVAIFYALGYTPDQIEELFATLDQNQLFGFGPDEGPSLLGLAGVTKWLWATIGEKTFDDLKLPCVVTAADLKGGREVLISEGSLVNAILATIAIPGIFPTRASDEWELVDGGVLNPVPVAPARALRPSLPVIAVVLSNSLGVPAQPWNIPLPNYVPRLLADRIGRMRYAQMFDVFSRALDITARAVTEYRLEVDKPDIVLRPAVAEVDTLDVVDVHAVAQKGEEIVEAHLTQIRNVFTWQYWLRQTLGA